MDITLGDMTAVTERDAPTPGVAAGAPINATCPRSGKPVSADSLAEYRGFTVGFCNPRCRDDFAANVAERPSDTDFFDAAIVGLSNQQR